jgi:hypothetical protein
MPGLACAMQVLFRVEALAGDTMVERRKGRQTPLKWSSHVCKSQNRHRNFDSSRGDEIKISLNWDIAAGIFV